MITNVMCTKLWNLHSLLYNAIIGSSSYVLGIKIASAKLCLVVVYLALSFGDTEIIFITKENISIIT